MSREKYEGLLEIAKEQVSYGVYAVEKAGYAELMNCQCKSSSELKKITKGLKMQGFKVLANKE